MGKSSRKKVAGHRALQPGEHVLDACWGMGRGMLKAADIAGSAFREPLLGKRAYAEELDEATTRGQGMASRIKHNGMFVLTDRRLLWMEAKTALGKPKEVNAEFPWENVEEVVYEKPILSALFSDGSAGGIHAADKPLEFIAAWQSSRPA